MGGRLPLVRILRLSTSTCAAWAAMLQDNPLTDCSSSGHRVGLRRGRRPSIFFGGLLGLVAATLTGQSMKVDRTTLGGWPLQLLRRARGARAADLSRAGAVALGLWVIGGAVSTIVTLGRRTR